MESSSVFDYANDFEKLVRCMRERPRMFYPDLRTLQHFLMGYECALRRLGAIHAEDTFNSQFSSWLYESRKLSMSSGWGVRIQALASELGADPDALFFSFFDEFVGQWKARVSELRFTIATP